MKRIALILLSALLIGSGALAEETSENLQAQIDSVISGLDLSSLETIRVPGFEGEMSVEAFVRALASGDTISGEDAVAWPAKAPEQPAEKPASSGSKKNEPRKKLLPLVLLPVILSSLLMHMLSAHRDSLCSLARSVCFVLILIPVMLLVFSELEHTRRTITGMTQRMDKLLLLCHACEPGHPADWVDVFLELERLDEGWTAMLQKLEQDGKTIPVPEVPDVQWEQLLVYFLYRHFLTAWEDGDVGSKAGFAVLSVRLLRCLKGLCPHVELAELARMYSAEVEYSTENLDILFDELL